MTWCCSSATYSPAARPAGPRAASEPSSQTCLNIQLAQRSLAAFSDFARRPGWEIDFKQVGYLFVLSNQSDLEPVRAQRRASERSRRAVTDAQRPRDPRALSAAGRRRHPRRERSRPATATSPPRRSSRAMPSRRAQHGAEIRVGCEVLDIDTRGDRITGVVTDHGSISTDTVICAAGAWSRRCGAMVGRRAAGDPAPAPDPVHRGDRRTTRRSPDDDRLRHELLLSPRGPGPADGHVGPQREAGIQRRDLRRLDPRA